VGHQKGFTLVELLVVLAIAGVIAMIAVPSYQRMLQRVAIDREKSDLLNLMMLARSEAVKRGQNTWVSASVAPWSGTLTVFLDFDGDRIQQPTEPTLGTLGVFQQLTLEGGAALTSGMDGNRVPGTGFSGTGDLIGGNGSLGLKANKLIENPGAYVGALCFNLSGRTTLIDFSPPKTVNPSSCS
jgi:prepilin-type N-terminal cleavage/methylation domain-containing protein